MLVGACGGLRAEDYCGTLSYSWGPTTVDAGEQNEIFYKCTKCSHCWAVSPASKEYPFSSQMCVFAWTYVCAPCACLMSEEARRAFWIICSWSHRKLWAALWFLRNEPRLSARATSILYLLAMSPHQFEYLSSLSLSSVCLRHALLSFSALSGMLKMMYLLLTVSDAVLCTNSPNLHSGPECELIHESWKLLSS